MESIEDLTYERRKEFLSKYPMPSELPVVSFHTEARNSPSRWSHVAHAELPVRPTLAAVMQPTKVPVVMPFGVVMSACARILETRYREKNNGLVTRRDAEVPGSVVVRPDRKIDHMWMAYTTLNDDPSEADASQGCEALLTLLVEVGQNWKHETTMKDE
ncbi:hypothetical protein MRB53_019227 [Persea americana]|uniref:Uncharacterized protein n=1 Tax=Persea americana TaxID=3435 RepID=A0ACC2KXL4_PERAE|nr:hypothetical protein MRB53_019227 [Persea americana]